MLMGMGVFDLFRRRKTSVPASAESIDDHFANHLAELAEKDYLGKAALARAEARTSKAAGDFNAAWSLYQDVKDLYRKHAMRYGFTAGQTLALDATLSPLMADILRREGKHYDALTHIIYWVAASREPSVSQKKKLVAYFKRCKFPSVELAEVHAFVESLQSGVDFVKIRNTVAAWRDRDRPDPT